MSRRKPPSSSASVDFVVMMQSWLRSCLLVSSRMAHTSKAMPMTRETGAQSSAITSRTHAFQPLSVEEGRFSGIETAAQSRKAMVCMRKMRRLAMSKQAHQRYSTKLLGVCAKNDFQSQSRRSVHLTSKGEKGMQDETSINICGVCPVLTLPISLHSTISAPDLLTKPLAAIQLNPGCDSWFVRLSNIGPFCPTFQNSHLSQNQRVPVLRRRVH
eukprot:3849269-Pleurochrysis_carterae.AAC.4